MAEVAIIVPVLMRPHRVVPLLESAASATPQGSWRLIFVCSPEDRAEQAAIKDAGGDMLVLPETNRPGDYGRKINYAYHHTAEPLILMGGDDIAFQPGWLEAASRLMAGPIGVVGTNDGANARVKRGEHSTHPLISRDYINREGGTMDHGPGVVLCPLYHHNFCDDELVATAKRRGVWAFAVDSKVAHSHPTWGTAPDDETYRIGRSTWRHDANMFACRMGLWR